MMTRELILLAAGHHSAFTQVTKLLHLKDTIRKGLLQAAHSALFQDSLHDDAKISTQLCSDTVLLYSDS